MGKITTEDECIFVDGVGFLRGFLDLLYYTSLADDGLENIDQDGLLAITGVAKEKLGEVEGVFKKLQEA